eukprot:m.383830 g.383830  ORF g.383830 m.383830 type:complete len:223 (+) comp28264_c0_seq11:31-699(+)
MDDNDGGGASKRSGAALDRVDVCCAPECGQSVAPPEAEHAAAGWTRLELPCGHLLCGKHALVLVLQSAPDPIRCPNCQAVETTGLVIASAGGPRVHARARTRAASTAVEATQTLSALHRIEHTSVTMGSAPQPNTGQLSVALRHWTADDTPSVYSHCSVHPQESIDTDAGDTLALLMAHLGVLCVWPDAFAARRTTDLLGLKSVLPSTCVAGGCERVLSCGS